MRLAEPSQLRASVGENGGGRIRPLGAVAKRPGGRAHRGLNGIRSASLAKAMTAAWALCLAFCLAGVGGFACAATITNYFGGAFTPQPQNLAINTGDTVVWVNAFGSSDYVESYGGEWASPMLDDGASFSVTFTNPGLYTYRTTESAQTGHGSGTVTVSACTNQPPPVTLNTPIDGMRFSTDNTASLQASVTNPAETVLVQYFPNATLVGSAANPPYAVYWLPSTPGAYALVAKATDMQGAVTESLPVNVQVLPPRAFLWGPRMLPTGAFLFFYLCPGNLRTVVYASDQPSLVNAGLLGGTLEGFGTVVDESAPGSGKLPRYYRIRGGD